MRFSFFIFNSTSRGAVQNDVVLFRREYKNTMDGAYQYNIYLDSRIFNEYINDASKYLDAQNYLSTDKNDINYGINIFGKSQQFRIYDFDHMIKNEKLNATYSIFSLDSKNKDKFFDEINSIENLMISFDEGYIASFTILGVYKFVLILLLFLYFSVEILIMSKAQKSLAVMKMYGYSSLNILFDFMKEFIKNILKFFLLLSVVVLVALFALD